MGTVLGAICMFLNGFVTLVPYHIVIICANHVIKRFHLPSYSVSLFIYKFHNPMELSNLLSTALAFALSLLNDGTFDIRNEDNIKIRRKVSFISMWLTLSTTMLSCLTFIIGGDRGLFQLFYYGIILMTLANGFSSCFAFAVNSNSIMYASGISIFSLVAFFLQKIYKHFYNKYNWNNYDYNLVIVQYSFAIFFLALTCTLWTVDQLNEMSNECKLDFNVYEYITRVDRSRQLTIRTEVEIDLSLTPTKEGVANGASYGSGSNQITVTKDDSDSYPTKVPNGYVRYKHTPSTIPFTLGSVKHDDQELDGIVGASGTPNVQAVYVYYKTGDDNHVFPLIVCVVKQSGHTYYKRMNKWIEIQNLNDKNPNDISETILLNTIGSIINEYEIKLEWSNTFNRYPATFKKDTILVSELKFNDYTYKGFKHSITSAGAKEINRITIYNHVISGITEVEGSDVYTITNNNGGVYVYFKTTDVNNEKPLLICLSKDGTKSNNESSGNNIWYKRRLNSSTNMYGWMKDLNKDFDNVKPDDIYENTHEHDFESTINRICYETVKDVGYPKRVLISELGYTLKSRYIPKNTGGNTIKYITCNDGIPANRVVIVEKMNGVATGNPVPIGYIRYKHYSTSAQFKLSLVMHNDILFNGIPETTGVQAVYVYYSTSDIDHEFPLIVCVKINNNVRKYYTRGFSWTEDTSLRGVNPDDANTAGQSGGELQTRLDNLKVVCEIDIKENIDYKASAAGDKITVKRKENTSDGVPQGYYRYEHKLQEQSTNQFKLGFVMHNDDLLSGIDETENVEAVYVYYSTGDRHHKFPLIVCVKKSDTDRTYYTRGQTWTNAGQTLNAINPESTDAGEADKPLAKKLGTLVDKYEINIGNTTDNQKYKTNANGLEITVYKGYKSLPFGYNRYEHKLESGNFALGIVRYNDVPLNGIKYGIEVEAIYVYYHNKDEHSQFPLIVCVKINNNVRKYYIRGSIWNEDKGLSSVNPDSANDANTLRHKLDTLKDIYEVRIEFTNTVDNGNYKSNAGGTTITVTKKPYTDNNVPAGYVAYTHSGNVTGTVKFKHNGVELNGLPTSGVNIDNSNALWVYYKVENDNPIIDKPLLIYVKVNSIDTWYESGLKWKKTKNVSGDPNNSQINLASSIEKLFEGKLERQGTFKELIYSDNYYHWSPILMLSLSLATAYVFHPIITPHSLIDTERDEIMDLSIMIISLIPNFIFIILDNIQGDHGPSGKWDEGRWFYNYIWLIACIPYLICIFTLTCIFRYPNNWICSYIKGSPYVLGFFSITINTSLKLILSTALGGGSQQSVGGFIGSINQFSILLMLLLQLLITLFCNGHFNTFIPAENNYQPFTYSVYSPWSPLLLTNPTHVQQFSMIDHSNYPELISGL